MNSISNHRMATSRDANGDRARAKKRFGARGAVLVEYSLVLAFVAVPAVMGIIYGGALMVRDYRIGRDAILQSTP